MSWITLDFSKKHKGKTLPQIIFSDPDWFFWAYEEKAFDDNVIMYSEAKQIYKKSRSILIPNNSRNLYEVEYLIHPNTNNFAEFRIVEKNKPIHIGSSSTIRKDVIDFEVVRKIQGYDKTGYKLFLICFKYIFFGSRDYVMTKKRCEVFFENNKNFAI